MIIVLAAYIIADVSAIAIAFVILFSMISDR